MTANAAIYYVSEAFDTSRDRLMGRHAAGESFLHAFARTLQARQLYRSTLAGHCQLIIQHRARRTRALTYHGSEHLDAHTVIFEPSARKR